MRDTSRRADLDGYLPLLYAELRRLACAYLGRERTDHTLQPTALVHEAYMRLASNGSSPWRDRAHFLSSAALVMRRVLIDHARSHLSEKRGNGVRPVPLDTAVLPVIERAQTLVDLDTWLRALEQFDSRKAAIVDLRYFGGLTIQETAEALSISEVTVVREWRLARAWLHQRLYRNGSPPIAPDES